MEIERRFFIKNIEKVKELISEYKDSKKVIVQDYIFSDIAELHQSYSHNF